MPDTIIELTGLGKRYQLSHQQSPDSLKAWLNGLVHRAPSSSSTTKDEEFWALRDVSLRVNEGECLALTGKNGSGKSSLLKILARVIPPTTGQARVRGRIAALLEIGTGFHPDLTGRENIFLSASMLGCPEKTTRTRFDDIVEFSGIHKFLDTPVKYYSSGMYVRLAYSVAAHVYAEILLIDEVLAVGDIDFHQKCIANIELLRQQGTTIVFVSHDTPLIQRLASHIAVLEQGRLIKITTASNLLHVC